MKPSFLRFPIGLIAMLMMAPIQKSNGQNLVFSGGVQHSLFLCDDGHVYGFGRNNSGEVGTGTATAVETLPQQVVGVGGVGLLSNIRQVDAGSGNFSLAVTTCGDSLLAWGNNSNGYLGDGTNTNSASPVRVLGIGGVGYLSGVQFISGGNEMGFAIMGDSRLVAWGLNDDGQLGDGTTTDRNYPAYVEDCSGNPLENVRYVDGGDDFGVALLEDGTVWFWGDDERGVGGQGVVNASGAGTKITCATQVMAGPGRPLENITQVTAGDGAIYALSSSDTLWAWGAHWGRQLGSGSTSGNDHEGYPVPVVDVGNTGGVLNGVIRIAAGNAHGVALLNTGEVVTWGLRRNGQLGDGDFGTCSCGTDGQPYPDYVLNPTGTGRLTGIADISEGDDGSFAIDSTGNLFIWGENLNGQLGLGDQTDRSLPVAISLPCLVPIPDPPLITNLGPDVDLCSPLSVTLNSGLQGVDETTFEWYYNGVQITGADQANLFIDTVGEYIVHAQRVTNCGTIVEDAYDTIQVTSSAPVAGNGTYCQGGGMATLTIDGPGGYQWYDAPVGGTQVGSGDTLQLFVAGPGDVIYYVEDSTAFAYTIGASGGNGNYRDATAGDYLVFTAYNDFTLDSVTVFNADEWENTAGGSIEISVLDDATGLPIAGGVQEIFFNVGNTTNGTAYQIPVRIFIPAGGPYRLAYTNNTDRRLLELGNGDHDPNAFPYQIAGVMEISANYDGGVQDDDRYSYFFDWVISYGSLCDRVPVVASEVVCPCTPPPGGTPALTPAGPLAICGTINEGLTSTTETGYYFQWYRDGAAIAAGMIDDNTYTATQAGDYYVRIVDDLANVDNGSCYEQSNTVTIAQEPELTPAITIDADNNTICAGQTVNFTIASQANEGGTPAYDWQVNGLSTATGTSFSPSNLVDGDVVRVVLTSSETCVSSATATSNTETVNVNPNLTPTITVTAGANNICPGTSVNFSTSGTNLGAGPTYAWTLNGGSVGGNSDTYSSNALVDGDVVEVTVTSNETCLAATTAIDDVTMTVRPLTGNAGAITGTTTICDNALGEGFSIDPVADATGYTWTVSGDGNITGGQGSTSITVDFGTNASYTVEVTPTGDCGDGTSSQLTVNNTGSVAAAVVLSQLPDPVCVGSQGVIYASITGGGATPVVEWYLNGAGPVAGTVADSLVIAAVTAGDQVEAILTGGASCATGLPASSGVFTVQTDDIPVMTGSIIGADTVCVGASETYSIPASTNADFYTWIAPGIVTPTSTLDALSLDVTGASMGGGTLEVTASNACGTTAAETMDIVGHDVPEQPSLNGLTAVCENTLNIAIGSTGATRATGYTWTVTGGSLASGQGTDAITVDVTTADASITIVADNSCGVSPAGNHTILIDQPTVDPIVGSTQPDCQSPGNPYSTTDNGLTYTWSVTGDATIASGQGTAAIVVDFGKQNAVIQVVAENATGCRDSVTLVTDLQNCALEANFIADVVSTCSGDQVTFTDLSVGNVSDWNWDFGPNASPSTITGEGPHTVVFTNGNAAAQLETVSLSVGNGLLTDDTIATDAFTINPIPSAPVITGDDELCEGVAGAWQALGAAGSTMNWNWPVDYAGITGNVGPDNFNLAATVGSTTGIVSVTETSAANCTGPQTDFDVTILVLPDAAGTITGPTELCVGSNGTWTIAVVPNATSYAWSLPTELTLDADNSLSIDGTAALEGTGTVSVTPENSCGTGASSTLEVTVNDVPSAPLAITGEITPCEQTTETYAISEVAGALSYSWTTMADAVITSGQGTSQVEISFGTNDETIAVTAENSCGSSLPTTLNATILLLPEAAGPITGSESLCAGAAGEIYGIAAVANATTYNWTLPVGAVETSNAGEQITVDFLVALNGTITVVPENSCGTGAPAELEVEAIGNTAPSISLTLSVDTACIGEQVLVTALPSGEGDNPAYSWTIGGSPGSSSGTTQTVTVSDAGSLQVQVDLVSSLTCLSNNSATASTAILGIAPPVPVFDVSANHICETETISVTFSPESNTSYSWVTPQGTVAPAEDLVLSSAPESGDYALVADNGYCDAVTSSNETILIDEQPIANFEETQTIEVDVPATIQGSVSIGTVLWAPTDLLDDTTSENPTVLSTDQELSEFVLTVRVTNGNCMVEQDISMNVLLPIKVPNTFTPNNDGINDTWNIRGMNAYPQARVLIYNRWGSAVYDSFNYDKPWDGMRNGKNLPSATYYYVISLNEAGLSDEEGELHGDVTIIR